MCRSYGGEEKWWATLSTPPSRTEHLIIVKFSVSLDMSEYYKAE